MTATVTLCQCLDDIPVIWPLYLGQIGVHRFTLTPEIATHWITDHASRPPNDLIPGVVDRYSDVMASGGWSDEGRRPIMFSQNGVLLDGHHRCHSVVRSGCTLRLAVYRQAC